MPVMFGFDEQFEIFKLIVCFHPIFMMNNFIRSKKPADMFLHHETVLKYIPFAICKRMIRTENSPILLISPITNTANKRWMIYTSDVLTAPLIPTTIRTKNLFIRDIFCESLSTLETPHSFLPAFSPSTFAVTGKRAIFATLASIQWVVLNTARLADISHRVESLVFNTHKRIIQYSQYQEKYCRIAVDRLQQRAMVFEETAPC